MSLAEARPVPATVPGSGHPVEGGCNPRLHRSVLSLIGGTPVLDVSELLGDDRPAEVELFAKLEGQNIAGSVKDRPALYMVQDAIERGRLRPGMQILEASSGNTAIAVSMLARVFGFGVRIIAPASISEERKQLLSFYGARVDFSPGDQSTKVSRQMAAELAARDRSLCWLDQYSNPANPLAHYETTGPEIVQALGHVDVLVAGLGSGGTVTGTGRYLRRQSPDVALIGVEPHPGMKVAGLRSLEEDSFIPDNLDLSLLDGKMLASSRRAFAMVRRAAGLGLFLGMSAGAILDAAVRRAQRLDRGRVCAVLPDAGWKYMSVGICQEENQLGDAVDRVLEVSW